MRRILFLSLALVALLGFVAPPEVFGQAAAPTPKFTITGRIDSVGSWSQNLVNNDANRNRDALFYGRTRGRFDIIGEVGAAKGVFGFEIDATWGQMGFVDSNNTTGCQTSSAGAVTCNPGIGPPEASFDLNTDTQGNLQFILLFRELPLSPLSSSTTLFCGPFRELLAWS